MTSRRTGSERRVEVARAALALLAELPVEQLSTRRVAGAVGISQPALFKHFRSRESILTAVLALVREEMQRLVHECIVSGSAGLVGLEALLTELGGFVERNPGVPRLLFHELAQHQEPGSALRAPLRHLVSMQRALFAEFLRGSRSRGELPRALDAPAAANELLALVRGKILAWQLGELGASLAASLVASLRVAWKAWEQGVPARRSGKSPDPVTRLQALLQLDVRARIASGEDPLEEILEALGFLAEDGALVLTAPFEPKPLLTLLRRRGFDCAAEELGDAHWRVFVRGGRAPEIADLRGLPAPEPLEAVLATRGRLGPGHALMARLPRRPELLLQRLGEFGDTWHLLELEGGEVLLHARRTEES